MLRRTPYQAGSRETRSRKLFLRLREILRDLRRRCIRALPCPSATSDPPPQWYEFWGDGQREVSLDYLLSHSLPLFVRNVSGKTINSMDPGRTVTCTITLEIDYISYEGYYCYIPIQPLIYEPYQNPRFYSISAGAGLIYNIPSFANLQWYPEIPFIQVGEFLLTFCTGSKFAAEPAKIVMTNATARQLKSPKHSPLHP